MAFPAAVRDDMGNALGITQFGGTPPNAKPWKGLGPGVLELVESHEGNAYRAVYTVRFAEAVYVLHAFQKKSPSGISDCQDRRGPGRGAAKACTTGLRGTPWQSETLNRSTLPAAPRMCLRIWVIR